MVPCATDTETRDISVEKVLEAIRTGGKNLKGQITQIRNRFEAELDITGGDRKKARLAVDALKKQLPAVMWSGTFSQRANNALIQHSGLLVADIDSLGERLPEVRKKLQESPYVFALSVSPSGDGLKPIFLVLADASKHAGSFRAVEKHVRSLTGIQIDQACKDLARLCFMPYDPELYVNVNAQEIAPLPEPLRLKPKLHPNGEYPTDLSLRERIARDQLGMLTWSPEKGGHFCKCPGESLHTTLTARSHAIVYLDGAPTMKCQHNSCAKTVEAFNLQLRSAIAKAEYKHQKESDAGVPPTESIRWTRPPHPSSTEVRGQIISILTNEEFSLAKKRIKIADAVVAALAERGQFFFDIAARNFKSTMFFDRDRKRLEQIAHDPFHAWLSDWLRINRADPIFTHVISEIETVALSEKYSKGIVPDKFWASRPGAIYLSNGDAQLVKITAHGIAIFDNGTDNVLFAAGNTLAPWKLVEPQDPFETCSVFKDANCASDHGPDLLRLWTFSLPSNPAKKPPMCLVGPFGSGKTRLAEATAELYGVPFVANNVTEDFGDDDFWVSAHAGGFFTLDNCDTHTKWLADAVAAAATGGHRDKRKLYTDSERYTLHARAWLCLTTANPTFASDVGLADRLLVVRMNRRDDETADEKLSAEIKEHRDAGLSFIAQTLEKALADSEPVPSKLNLRHPDFAAFAAKIGRAIGRFDQAVAALQKAEKDKSLFCLENDFVGSALLDYLDQEKTFTGPASELRDALKDADSGFINKDGKPSVKSIGRRLQTLWPYLTKSLAVATKDTNRTRTITYTFSTTRDAEFAES